MRNRFFALTFAAVAMVSAAVTPAFADPRDASPSITVEYDDLNLGRTADAEDMLVRLEDASRRVCRSAGQGLRGIARFEARQTCEAQSLERAVAQLDAPVVTALHQGETLEFQTAMR
jgi:UrcA family protein